MAAPLPRPAAATGTPASTLAHPLRRPPARTAGHLTWLSHIDLAMNQQLGNCLQQQRPVTPDPHLAIYEGHSEQNEPEEAYLKVILAVRTSGSQDVRKGRKRGACFGRHAARPCLSSALHITDLNCVAIGSTLYRKKQSGNWKTAFGVSGTGFTCRGGAFRCTPSTRATMPHMCQPTAPSRPPRPAEIFLRSERVSTAERLGADQCIPLVHLCFLSHLQSSGRIRDLEIASSTTFIRASLANLRCSTQFEVTTPTHPGALPPGARRWSEGMALRLS